MKTFRVNFTVDVRMGSDEFSIQQAVARALKDYAKMSQSTELGAEGRHVTPTHDVSWAAEGWIDE